MQGSNLDVIRRSLSDDRLTPYGSGPASADHLAKYMWNVCLCESLYPLLHFVEVGLRNATDRAMTVRYGVAWWNSPQLRLNHEQTRMVQQAQEELRRRHVQPTPGRIIAELHFGFWTSMYARHMEHSWHGILKHAVPRLTGKSRTRRAVSNALQDLRLFRNRIFHHERILHWPHGQHHATARQVLGWVSEELLATADAVDRYPQVHGTGLDACREKMRLLEERGAIESE